MKPRNALLASVLSAGSGLVAAEARADIIVTNVNQDIGFKPGDVASVTIALPGNVQLAVGRMSSNVRNGGQVYPFRTLFVGGNVAVLNGIDFYDIFAKRVQAGMKAGTLNASGDRFGGGGLIQVAGLVSQTTYGGGKFSNQYFLFMFQDTVSGNSFEHGWIKGSLTDDSYNGLTYHFDSYAYDTSGADLAAGDTGPAKAPEPASAALALLGALTLGATGVRRWRTMRITQTRGAA